MEKARLENLIVSELDLTNELDLVEHPVMARMIYDNTYVPYGIDVLSSIRSFMSYSTFDPSRVTYSAWDSRSDFAYTPNYQFFSDVPLSHPNAYYINIMKEDGITNGYGSETIYAPNEQVPRSMAAVFIVRAIFLAHDGELKWEYTSSPYFSDVGAGHPQFAYIQKLRDLRISGGYPDGRFGPDDLVTRGMMAVFAVRAWQVARTGRVDDSFDYNPYSYFMDVSPSHSFFKWIQKAQELGFITDPCGSYQFCPDTPPHTRGSISSYLVRAIRGRTGGYEWDCWTAYGHSARVIGASAVYSGITGGLIGRPNQIWKTKKHGLACGNDTTERPLSPGSPDVLNTLFQMPAYHTAPTIVDLHTYPCKNDSVNPSRDGKCDLSQPASPQSEARETFTALRGFMADKGIWGAAILGETHSNTFNGIESCEWAPALAAQNTVNGFNQSTLAGRQVVFRPWLYPWSSCYPFPTTVNPPYTPTP